MNSEYEKEHNGDLAAELDGKAAYQKRDGERMEIVIKITGQNIDQLDADAIADMVFNSLDDAEYDVAVTGEVIDD